MDVMEWLYNDKSDAAEIKKNHVGERGELLE